MPDNKKTKFLTDLIKQDFRITPKTMEHLRYFATENGLSIQESVRQILWGAVKDSKPPIDLENKAIDCSSDEWAAWQDLASHTGIELSSLIRQVLNKLTKQHLPK